MNQISKIFTKQFIKYGLMACIIVLIELGVFQTLYISTENHILATVISFIVGVALNWIIGRIFIFDKSRKTALKEFLLVLAASVVGVIIQIAIVIFSVEVLGLYALLGKILSIVFSFFWNYWFRARFVYNQN